MLTKICGIKNEDTLVCCENNKVNFFGMIFYPKSPRNISFENASMLQKKSESLNIKGVGVFVNKNINQLEENHRSCATKNLPFTDHNSRKYCFFRKKEKYKFRES